jgi:hypothetical protein
MSLRSKLTAGLGFLFLIIFAITIYGLIDIQGLSRDAEKIIKDNYDSLVYCKNMLVALDDMRTGISSMAFGSNRTKVSAYYSHLFETSKSTFESNLSSEKGNITEIGEKDYVEELIANYTLYLNIGLGILRNGAPSGLYFDDFLPAYASARQSVIKINDLNMQAIQRKSLATKRNAGNMVDAMGVVGAICILLAFFYFWYFPFYISTTTAYLAKRMKELLEKKGIKFDMKTKDEAFVLLQSINLLEKNLMETDT